MLKKLKADCLELMSFCNGLVFFAPVALLVRLNAGISVESFFILQAILSLVIFVCEIPTGRITDKVGYRDTIVISEVTLLAARILIMLAFIFKSYPLFIIEAVVEGISACFSSGTKSAYLYNKYEEKEYVVKSARVGNWGTAGFIISTVFYALILHFYGLLGLIVATVAASLVGLFFSFGIEKEVVKNVEKKEKSPKVKFSLSIESGLIIVVLACVSMAFILINFFYVDKLQVIGVSEEWMTAIILVYSAIEMLAETVLKHTDESKYLKVFTVGFLIIGMMMILFGVSNNIFVIIPMMLVMPLVISVPAYIFDEIENKIIDANGLGESRAEVLSIYNMGVNLLEIVFLFSSAFIAKAGVSLSFIILGMFAMVVGFVGYFVFRSKIDLAQKEPIVQE